MATNPSASAEQPEPTTEILAQNKTNVDTTGSPALVAWVEKLDRASLAVAEIQTLRDVDELLRFGEGLRGLAVAMQFGFATANRAVGLQVKAGLQGADILDEARVQKKIAGHGGDRGNQFLGGKQADDLLADFRLGQRKEWELRQLRRIFATDEEVDAAAMLATAEGKELSFSGLVRQARELVRKEKEAGEPPAEKLKTYKVRLNPVIVGPFTARMRVIGESIGDSDPGEIMRHAVYQTSDELMKGTTPPRLVASHVETPAGLAGDPDVPADRQIVLELFDDEDADYEHWMDLIRWTLQTQSDSEVVLHALEQAAETIEQSLPPAPEPMPAEAGEDVSEGQMEDAAGDLASPDDESTQEADEPDAG